MVYVQGFVIPVPTDKKDAYRAMCEKVGPIFKEYGVLRMVETWGVDVPDGEVTDFRRSVQAEAGESVVFSWLVWPDKTTCDEAASKIMEDPRMRPDGEIPFDGKRMIFGGFEPIYDDGGEG